MSSDRRSSDPLGRAAPAGAIGADALRAVYSPKLLEELYQRLGATLRRHFEGVCAGDGPVLNWESPPINIAAARELLRHEPIVFRGDAQQFANEVVERFERLTQTILDRGQNLHHPHYIGHQVPASLPIGGVFDAVGAATNQVMAVYEMGPWATAIERALIAELGTAFGLQLPFAGLVTNGGSLANLTGLLTARNVRLQDVWERGMSGRSPAIIIVQQDAHYGIARSAGILGLGTSQIRRAPLDAQRRMDPNQLEEMLRAAAAESTPVVAVVACSGATPTGAFDPLEPIAEICQRYGVWLHVDAAHGGAVALSSRHRNLIAGIEQADSFICDAHKMLFVPALCAFVFYRQAEHRFSAFCQDAPYLFDPSAPGMADYDCGLMTIECTKRGAATGMWGVWSLFGPDFFGQLVDHVFALTRTFYEKLLTSADFIPLHEPQSNIQVFRFRNDGREIDHPEIRRRLIESGKFYIAQTRLDGLPALRCTVMNPLTTPQDLDELLENLAELRK